MKPLILGVLILFAVCVEAFAERPPNVILIMSDDQGYGDLGVHGNPRIRTPNLDRLANQGVRLNRFCVSPVCSPTRASLMTGRYNYRTGVVDTYLGRSMMHPDELTLAERLAHAGYRTGIFGKWHLGDNVPLRALDQGFRRALVLKGGGIGQPSDLPGGSHYTDPVLLDDGRTRRVPGYCSDLFTTAAIEFLNESADRPFLLYLAFNCPHAPLEPPLAEWETYRDVHLGPGDFPRVGNQLPLELDQNRIARVYAMVTNIDANIGRLLTALERRGQAASTIVVFLTDNGPAFPRYNAGLRGLKGTVYEGGIRVPCLIRWPGHFPSGRIVNQPVAHIDVVPTLLEACGIQPGKEPGLDGQSMLPLLEEGPAIVWPDRTLFAQWHRGDVPQEGRAFAAWDSTFKLLRPEGPSGASLPSMELYDIVRDPFEQNDLSASRPKVVERLEAAYRRWFSDVSRTRGFAPVRIEIGNERENPLVLTPQDWREATREGNRANHHWELQVDREGLYDISVHVRASESPLTAHLAVQELSRQAPLPPGATDAVFRGVELHDGHARLQAWVGAAGSSADVVNVLVERTGRLP